MTQCVAVCCGVLQCVAVCCSVLQCDAVCCGVMKCVAVCCSVLQLRLVRTPGICTTLSCYCFRRVNIYNVTFICDVIFTRDVTFIYDVTFIRDVILTRDVTFVRDVSFIWLRELWALAPLLLQMCTYM